MHRFILSIVFTGLVIAGKMKAQTIAETNEFTIVNSTKDPEAGLVIFPGAYLTSHQYTALASQLVNDSDGALAVYIAKFAFNFANPLQAGIRVQKVIDEFAGLGWENPARRVFLAGHSQGGIMASGVAKDKGVGGLILLGSYLPETAVIGEDFTTYPVPTLTLGGDLDGLTGINFVAREYGKYLDLVAKDPSQKYRMPVVVLEGVNHMQFADGSYLKGDLTAELSLDQAHAQITKLLLDFIGHHEPGLALFGNDELAQALETTALALSPFLQGVELDQNTCQDAQYFASGFADADYATLEVSEKVYTTKSSYPAFVFDKSAVTSSSIYLASYIESALNLFDVSQDTQLSAEVIGCKMRSQQSLVEAMGFTPARSQASCAELNYRSLGQAYALIQSEVQLNRIQSNLGLDFSLVAETDFLEEEQTVVLEAEGFRILDTIKSRGDQWAIGSFPSLKLANGTWTLQTYSVNTGTDAVGNFGGAFYCKVYPVSRFVEWLQLFHMKN